MSKQDLQEAANKLFAIHKLERLFMTTDGQGFTEKHRATSHAQSLKDEQVYEFEPADAPKVDANPGEDLERDALVVIYEEVFGKKPNHNMKSETIQTKIDEQKEADQKLLDNKE